jgi:hypothetical protein
MGIYIFSLKAKKKSFSTLSCDSAIRLLDGKRRPNIHQRFVTEML